MVGPIRTLIVDDEPAARAALRTLLNDDPEIQVVGEAADGRAAVETIEHHEPDLVFLDIQMPEMDGFAVLASLEVARIPVIVFVTAYDQYALQAFEVHAIDYLLKPYSDDRFREALAHAKNQVGDGKAGAVGRQIQALLEGLGQGSRPPAAPDRYLRRLTVKSGGRVTILPVKDVDWVEAEGDYVRIHVGRQWHLLRETMKQIEAQLDPGRFVRIHRSTIVNVDRIKELQPFFRGEYVVILQDGTSLKLSRGYKSRLETILGRGF
ncbi:MAG: response regulator transcription factor [Gemmatimonadetes bacterium]|nr:response regulator transcription factor [Gemmatimonadota bacterium]